MFHYNTRSIDVMILFSSISSSLVDDVISGQKLLKCYRQLTNICFRLVWRKNDNSAWHVIINWDDICQRGLATKSLRNCTPRCEGSFKFKHSKVITIQSWLGHLTPPPPRLPLCIGLKHIKLLLSSVKINVFLRLNGQELLPISLSCGHNFYSQLNNKIVEWSSFPFIFVFFDAISGNSMFCGSSSANVSLVSTENIVSLGPMSQYMLTVFFIIFSCPTTTNSYWSKWFQSQCNYANIGSSSVSSHDGDNQWETHPSREHCWKQFSWTNRWHGISHQTGGGYRTVDWCKWKDSK